MKDTHSAALAALVTIASIAPALAVTFTDVPVNAWFATYVNAAANAGIVSGYTDAQGRMTGKYGPGNNVTIGEALKIASEGAGYDETTYGSGVSGHWAAIYLGVARAESFDGALEGHLDAKGFDTPATRAEVASLIAGAFKVNLERPADNRYDDVTFATMFFFDIEALSRDGILSGDLDVSGRATGRFRPTDSINRAEVAKIVMAARAQYGTPVEEPGIYEDDFDASLSYDESGFTPDELRIKAGDTVRFLNISTGGLKLSSDPHPTHENFPDLNVDHVMIDTEFFEVNFPTKGTFGFHNHLNPSHHGTIIVE
jgi:plastocyanin